MCSDVPLSLDFSGFGPIEVFVLCHIKHLTRDTDEE